MKVAKIGKVYRCPARNCEKEFTSFQGIKDHRQEQKCCRYVCREPGCDRQFRWRSSLASHKRSHRAQSGSKQDFSLDNTSRSASIRPGMCESAKVTSEMADYTAESPNSSSADSFTSNISSYVDADETETLLDDLISKQLPMTVSSSDQMSIDTRVVTQISDPFFLFEIEEMEDDVTWPL